MELSVLMLHIWKIQSVHQEVGSGNCQISSVEDREVQYGM